MSAVLTALEEEWGKLARSPKATRALRRWASTYSALAGHRDLTDVLRCSRGEPASAPAILRALALLAPEDELAARTLVHAVIPGIVSIAENLAKKGRARRVVEAIDELLAIAWVRVRTYPGHRPGSVAANTLYDIRKEYLRCHPQPRRLTPDPAMSTGMRHCAVSAEHDAMDRLMLNELVTMGQRRGHVSPDALALVIRTRVAETPMDVIATERHASPEVLTTLRWRAERRLRRLPLAG